MMNLHSHIKLFLTICLITFTQIKVSAQGFSFLNTVTSSSSGYQASVRAVKVDQLGNKYIAGNFDISATIKNTTITGNTKDIFFGKIDPLGNPIWIKTAGGPDSDQAMDIELDNQGGLYISGLFSGAANFDGNTVTAIQPSSNAITMSDNFLVKYDTSGNFQWIKTGATTDNDFNQNVNGYNNNTFNYYGKSKIKFKNGNIYLMASNRISGSQIGAVNPAGRQFDGITLPNTQAPGGGGFFGYKYLNSFILKTDVNGTNSWLTPVYCNTNQDSDAVIGLDFDVNSNDHVIAQYYYSSNGCKIGGQSTPSSISSFSTPSANFPNGALMILELDGSGFYNNVYKLENALSSFNSFFGFGNALNYTSHGVSVDNLDNVYFAFNNYSNINFNQTIAGINIPENTNTLVKLNPNFVPANCNLLNTFPSQSQNSFPISALEIKEDQLIFGGTLDGTINLDNSTFSRSDEITFVNMDTNLSSVNWVTSTSNSSVLQVDGSGANAAFPEKYSLGIYDLSIGNENQAVFCGNIGPQYRSFGDYTTTTNQLNDAFVTEIIPCSPVFSQITPTNPVICGAGNSATLNANVSSGISYNWVSNGNSTSSSNTSFYTTTNVGDFSLITDSLGCKDTSNIVNVTLAPLPNVTVPQSTFTACFTGGPTVVPAGTPSGGVWSGLGMVNDSVFDPTILGPGPSLITYTFTNAQGCSDDGIRIANTVQTPPLILSNNLPEFCEGDGPYSLGATVNPTGGTYFGPGVSGLTFDPNSAGVGTHLIRYKYSVAQNCEDSVDFYLVVNAKPNINFPAYNPLCEDVSSTPLFSASPFGGTYSGPFVISNNFYPFFSGAGSFPITYTVTENGCTSSSTQNIQIDPLPNTQINNLVNYCINDDEIVLNFGTPTGGIYKIDGIVSNTLNPKTLSIGSHDIEYEYTNSCGTSTANKTFEIFDIPDVVLSEMGPFCLNDSAVVLNNGTPSNGSFSIADDFVNLFTPSSYGVGSVQVDYTYTDSNGCLNKDSINVVVNSLPSVDAGNDKIICFGDTVVLEGNGANSYIWNNGVIDGDNFIPNSTNSYVLVGTDANLCRNSDTVLVVVNSLPIVNAGIDQSICFGDSTILFTSGPLNYTWSNGIINGQTFIPNSTNNYILTGTDGNLCINSDTVNVTVNSLPNVDAGNDFQICSGDDVILNGNGAQFYNWNNGVINGTAFTPLSTTSYLLTGSDQNGCINSDTVSVIVNQIPILSSSIDSIYCINDQMVSLNALPNGGIWTGSGVSNNQLDPLDAGFGTQIIQYSFTDNNGCSETLIKTIEIKNIPTVNLSNFTPICNSNSATIPLSGGTPLGGNYSGIGVSNNNFNPSISGSGFHTITYTYSDQFGCSSSDIQNLTVDTTLVNLTQSPFIDVCENGNDISLSGGTPTGGIYSGIGVNNGNFSPSLTGPGDFSISYSYLEANSCIATITEFIKVNPKPTVSLNSIDALCENDFPLLLNQGLPVGGNYSGTAVNNNLFSPVISGTGNFPITYSFADTNGCINESTKTVTVNQKPNVTLSALGSICLDSGIVNLSGGLPNGGIYSGLGVINSDFDPMISSGGVFDITYKYTNTFGCSDSATETITVNNPVANLSTLSDICIDANPLNLSAGSPSGGEYSGLGVSNGTFNPINSGVGTFTIYYTNDIGGCLKTDSQTIQVNDLPSVNFPTINDICFSDSILLTEASPTGGIYSGIGVLNGVFNSLNALIGSNIINYSFTDTNGCSNNLSSSIIVNDLPVLSEVSTSLWEFCNNESIVTLSNYIPQGGIYSGTGIINNQFSPTTTNPGFYPVSYSYTDSSGCQNQILDSINLKATPTITLISNPVKEFCSNAPSINLNIFSPAGGSYSGLGINNNIFDPSIISGNVTIDYFLTDSNGCTNNQQDSLIVYQTQQAVLDSFSICENSQTLQLTYGSPSGGFYSGNGIINDNFNPLSVSSGVSVYSYQFTDSNGCVSTDTSFITINALPNTSLILPNEICLSAGNLTLYGGTPMGGIYNGLGVVGNQLDPAVNGIGFNELTYSYTDSNNCSSSSSDSISVLGNPIISIFGDTTICQGLSSALSATGAISYVWNNGDTNNIITESPTINTTYSVSGFDTNGCKGQDSISVVVNSLPNLNISAPDTLCSDSIASITAITNASSFYWSNGDTTQTLNIGPFSSTQTPYYSLFVIDSNGCTKSDSIELTIEDCIDPSHVNNTDDFEITVYPNPNNGVFNINIIDPNSEIENFILFSIEGKIIFKIDNIKSNYNFNLQDLSIGMYMLVFNTSSKSIQKKIIINN